MVDRAECAAGRPFKSESDDEPVEGAVVFPWSAGDAGVLRPVDRRRRHAFDHHDRIDGLSLCRFKSTGKWLLHLSPAAVRGEHVRLGIPDVDSFDLHWHIYSRAGLDLVLARRDLGP